mmetsp:Transcript_24045/g.66874  ORF Transcript_24045/g.66874 Transcript_24045/m.66874 type:complete len:274 (+) Transcript_24045:56-877(+)
MDFDATDVAVAPGTLCLPRDTHVEDVAVQRIVAVQAQNAEISQLWAVWRQLHEEQKTSLHELRLLVQRNALKARRSDGNAKGEDDLPLAGGEETTRRTTPESTASSDAGQRRVSLESVSFAGAVACPKLVDGSDRRDAPSRQRTVDDASSALDRKSSDLCGYPPVGYDDDAETRSGGSPPFEFDWFSDDSGSEDGADRILRSFGLSPLPSQCAIGGGTYLARISEASNEDQCSQRSTYGNVSGSSMNSSTAICAEAYALPPDMHKRYGRTVWM